MATVHDSNQDALEYWINSGICVHFDSNSWWQYLEYGFSCFPYMFQESLIQLIALIELRQWFRVAIWGYDCNLVHQKYKIKIVKFCAESVIPFTGSIVDATGSCAYVITWWETKCSVWPPVTFESQLRFRNLKWQFEWFAIANQMRWFLIQSNRWGHCVDILIQVSWSAHI